MLHNLSIELIWIVIHMNLVPIRMYTIWRRCILWVWGYWPCRAIDFPCEVCDFVLTYYRNWKPSIIYCPWKSCNMWIYFEITYFKQVGVQYLRTEVSKLCKLENQFWTLGKVKDQSETIKIVVEITYTSTYII